MDSWSHQPTTNFCIWILYFLFHNKSYLASPGENATLRQFLVFSLKSFNTKKGSFFLCDSYLELNIWNSNQSNENLVPSVRTSCCAQCGTGLCSSPAVPAAPDRVWRLHGWWSYSRHWALDMTWCSNASSSTPGPIQSMANPLLLTHQWREKLLISLLASSRKYVCCVVLAVIVAGVMIALWCYMVEEAHGTAHYGPVNPTHSTHSAAAYHRSWPRRARGKRLVRCSLLKSMLSSHQPGVARGESDNQM